MTFQGGFDNDGNVEKEKQCAIGAIQMIRFDYRRLD